MEIENKMTTTEHQKPVSLSDDIENYKKLIAYTLTETHGCPTEVCAAILSDYADEIAAMFQYGVASIGPAKLLYAEWKVFRSVK